MDEVLGGYILVVLGLVYGFLKYKKVGIFNNEHSMDKVLTVYGWGVVLLIIISGLLLIFK